MHATALLQRAHHLHLTESPLPCCLAPDFGCSHDGMATTDGSKVASKGSWAKHPRRKASTMRTITGTPAYMAPEIISEEPYGPGVDHWALGVLLFELLVGTSPYEACGLVETCMKIMAGKIEFPPIMSVKAKSLISKLLEPDPTKRLGFGHAGIAQCEDHAFFANVDWDALTEKRVAPPFQPHKEPLRKLHFQPTRSACGDSGEPNSPRVSADPGHEGKCTFDTFTNFSRNSTPTPPPLSVNSSANVATGGVDRFKKNELVTGTNMDWPRRVLPLSPDLITRCLRDFTNSTHSLPGLPLGPERYFDLNPVGVDAAGSSMCSPQGMGVGAAPGTGKGGACGAIILTQVQLCNLASEAAMRCKGFDTGENVAEMEFDKETGQSSTAQQAQAGPTKTDAQEGAVQGGEGGHSATCAMTGDPEVQENNISPQTAGDLNIILVDDSLTSCAIMSNILEPLVASVRSVVSGEQALSLVSKVLEPNLVVVDYNLHTGEGKAATWNGAKTISELRKHWSKAVFVGLSTNVQNRPDIQHAYTDAGAVAVVCKPMDKTVFTQLAAITLALQSKDSHPSFGHPAAPCAPGWVRNARTDIATAGLSAFVPAAMAEMAEIVVAICDGQDCHFQASKLQGVAASLHMAGLVAATSQFLDTVVVGNGSPTTSLAATTELVALWVQEVVPFFTGGR